MKEGLERAVVVAPGHHWAEHQSVPSELFHLVDRPFIQHVVEKIASLGHRRIDVILSHQPERFEAVLGDGSRWGLEITYHLARDPLRPYARMAALDLGSTEERGESVLLAHACRLPAWSGVEAESVVGGWGLVSPSTLRGIPASTTMGQLPAWLEAQSLVVADEEQGDGGPLLDARTPQAFLRATEALLDGRRGDLLRVGRAIPSGGWMAWNARVHPGATIEGPVFLGENCWVGDGAEVGPFAVIGAGAIVDKGTRVRHAVIEPDTYVGEGLHLERALARHGWLLNAGLGVAVPVRDQLMLSGTTGASRPHRPVALAERCLAAGAMLLSLPILVGTILVLALRRSGPVVFRPRVDVSGARGSDGPSGRRTARLFTFDPRYGRAGVVSPRTGGVRDLLLRVLPGLANVVRGDLALVGIEPRSPETIDALPEEWRLLCRSTRPGLITEAELSGGDDGGADGVFAAEALFAARGGLSHRLDILRRYGVACFSAPSTSSHGRWTPTSAF